MCWAGQDGQGHPGADILDTATLQRLSRSFEASQLATEQLELHLQLH